MIRVLSLFSGIGAFEKALENLGVEHEVVNYCEIDSHAAKAYSLIHGVDESKNLVDVTTVDTSKLKDIDLLTYGFPCVDISIAGKMKGFEDEDGNITRSGLFFEALRIIQDTKPKYAIAENVKNLMSKSFEKELDIVLNSLGAAGYNNYIKVLNAKDYGIPQNRERVFIVSIRRDADDFSFDFPQSKPLDLKLKDLLELDPDEKYFLEKSQMARMKINNKNALIYDCSMIGHEPHAREYNDIMPTITAMEYKDPRIVNHSKLHTEVMQIGNVWPSPTRDNPNIGRIYDDNGISPSLTTMQGGHRQPFIVASRGRYGEDGKIEQHLEPNLDGFSNTLTTVQKDNYVAEPQENTLRIRKLTPKECFRLMGFDDRDVDVLVENHISNTQLYKMAGNSIVVNVLMGIFNKLLIDKTPSEPDLFSAFEIY